MGLWNFFHKKKEEKQKLHLEDKKFKSFLKQNGSMESEDVWESKEQFDAREQSDFKEVTSSKELASSLGIEKQKIDLTSKEDRTNYIKNCCERAMESSRQIEEAKIEYSAVNSYLMDMQKIEQISKEEREDLEMAARDIITLTREQENYRDNNITLSSSARQTMQKYSDQIVLEIKKMQENEAYQRTIKSDIKYLEGEKGYLKYQRQEIIAKQKYLKGIAVTTSVLVVILFVLLFALAKVFKADMRPPFLLTILMAAISAAYIFFEANKNRNNMIITEKKLNKAIGLLNKVKIKYINNTSCLEYTYEKFGVSNSMELEHIWQQYEELKQREQKIKNNIDKLNANNEKLIMLLEKYQVEDPEVWIYQPAAIIDKKEMVEIRHRLNVRRQKLRDRIDYNSQVKSESLQEIQKVLEQELELKKEVITMLQNYQINI